MHGDAFRSARSSAWLIQGWYSSPSFFSSVRVPVHHLHNRWLQTNCKTEGLYGAGLHLRFQVCKYNCQGSGFFLMWRTCLCRNTFFLLNMDIPLKVHLCMHKCGIRNNLNLKVPNGIRWELLSAGVPFNGSSGSNYTRLTFGYMLNPPPHLTCTKS